VPHPSAGHAAPMQHFRSKDDLLAAVLDHQSSMALAHVEAWAHVCRPTRAASFGSSSAVRIDGRRTRNGPVPASLDLQWSWLTFRAILLAGLRSATRLPSRPGYARSLRNAVSTMATMRPPLKPSFRRLLRVDPDTRQPRLRRCSVTGSLQAHRCRGRVRRRNSVG